MASNIRVKIIGDASNFKKATETAGGALKGFGKIAGSIGGALAAREIFQFGEAAFKAATEDKKAQELLANTLRNTTGARDADIASVEKWISKTSVSAAVADDELRPALQTLLKSGMSAAEAQEALSTALDVSAASGKPVESVARDIAKANLGSAAALKKYGVATKDADGKTVSYAAAMKELGKESEGAADTLAESDGGIKRMSIRFDEMKEQVGAKLIPVVTKAMDVLLKVVTDVGEKIGAFWAKHGEKIKAAFNRIFGAIKSVVQRGLEIVRKFWADHGEQIMNAVRSAFDAVVSVVRGALEAVRKFWADHGDQVKGLIAKLVETFETIWRAVSDVFNKVKSIIERVLGWVSAFWDRWGAGIMNVVGTVFGVIVNVIKSALGIVQGIIKFVVGLITGDWSGAWDGIKAILSGAWETITALVAGALEILKSLFTAPFEAISGFVSDALDGIVDFFVKLPGRFTNALSSVFDMVTKPFKGIARWVKKNLIDKVVDYFKKLPDRFVSGLKNIGQVILDPFLWAFNKIVDVWNSTVGGMGFTLPDWLGGASFSIPEMKHFDLKLHQGGTFNAPAGRSEGLALLRDGERVLTPGARGMSGGGQGTNVVVNVAGSVLTEKQLMKTIRDAMVRDGRRGFAVA